MADLIDRAAVLDALGERPMLWINNDEYTLGARMDGEDGDSNG